MRADFALDYDVLTVERPQQLYLMARFEAGTGPREAIRRPLNLSLVIDRSGSMAGDKIDYTRQAAQFLVQHLNRRDIFSVVLYNDKVETLLEPEPVLNKDRVMHALDKMRVRGTTNLSGGWLQGCQHVAENLDRNTLNRVILMSDGLANRGVTDPRQLVQMARQKQLEGISTTTMGMGTDFNEDLLIEMAHAGGGAFYFIESPEVAPEIFEEELSGLLNVVGQNLIISIIPTQQVSSINQLNAYPVVQDGQKMSFRLGDIYGNEVKTLMLELNIPALPNLGEMQIATLRFEYDEVAGEFTEHQVRELPVFINVQDGAAGIRPLPNPDVAQSVLLLKAANARKNAVKAADNGEYQTASQILQAAADAIAEADLASEQLSEERVALLKQAEQIERGQSGYDSYERKSMSTQAIYTMSSRHQETMKLRIRERERDPGVPEKRGGETGEFDLPEAPTVRDEPPSIASEPGITPTHVRWKDEVFALQGDLIRLGRASHNEIKIIARGVSRFHAQIHRRDDKFVIEDLDSTNGTTINGKPLEGQHTLSVGDVVHLCDEKLVFSRE